MTLDGPPLRQRDGISCGPSVAVLAAALLEPDYGQALGGVDSVRWFAAEQLRVHRAVNRVWPRRLGMTPRGLAAAINVHSPVRYRWRLRRPAIGRGDPLVDVVQAVARGLPVAMLVGRFIPRHWVLFVGVQAGGDRLRCYEPSSGLVRLVDVAAVRAARCSGLGYPRPFAFVLPAAVPPSTRCAR